MGRTSHGKPAYYAVAKGGKPGIYRSWDDASAQVSGHSGAVFKKFSTETEAVRFIQERGGSLPVQSSYQPILPSNSSNSVFLGSAVADSGAPDFNPFLYEVNESTNDKSTSVGCEVGIAHDQHHSGQTVLVHEDRELGNHLAKYRAAIQAIHETDLIFHSRIGRPPTQASSSSDDAWMSKTNASGTKTMQGDELGMKSSWDEAAAEIRGHFGAISEKYTSQGDTASFAQQCSGSNSPASRSDAIICFTDGACKSNGQRGSSGGYAVVFPDHAEFDRAAPLSPGNLNTNNRAEYRAAVEAIHQADAIDPSGLRPLVIHSDSKLLCDSFKLWMPKWKVNNWKSSTGAEVKNRDLLLQIDERVSRRPLTVIHVRAHTGKSDYASKWNAVADQRASSAAQRR